MHRFIFYYLICLVSINSWGQIEQAWVIFTPKNVEDASLNNASSFLTEKALARKERFNIPIDSRDFPLDQNQVNLIKNEIGINYITQSKWFNAIYVSGTEANINALKNFDFVARIFFMNRALNTNNSSKRLNPLIEANTNKFLSENTFFYGNTSTQINQINLPPLHSSGFTGKGITIAVLDSGFENVDIISGFDRVRNNGQILGGYDFPNRTNAILDYKNSDHGTSVLSCMAGFIEGEFVGTAPDANYYLFRTEIVERESPEEEAFWIASAERADSLGVDILNTSLGYTTFDEPKYNYTPADMNGETSFISQATNIALEKGMLPVTSAGNTGNTSWRITSAPADSPASLSVGAVTESGNKASFSAFGPTDDGRIKPDVVALGQGSSVLNDQGNITNSSGTSFSGPIVAGGVACLWQALPNKKPEEIIDLIRDSASIASNPNQNIGYGIVNFAEAAGIETLTSLSDSSENLLIEKDLLNTSVYQTLKINPAIVGKTITIFSLQGKSVFETVADNTTINIDFLEQGVYIFKQSKNKNGILFIKN